MKVNGTNNANKVVEPNRKERTKADPDVLVPLLLVIDNSRSGWWLIMSESLKPDEQLEQDAEKLRACRSLAAKINIYGLDISLTEKGFANLKAFKDVWKATKNDRERATLLQMSGLAIEDVVALVEFLKYLKEWEINQSYGS